MSIPDSQGRSNDTPVMTHKAKVVKTRLLTLVQPLLNRWGSLGNRDRAALKLLALFFVLVGGFLLLSSSHKLASAEKMRYMARYAEYFWLREQAGQLRGAPLEKNQDMLQQVFMAAGVQAEIVPQGAGWQLMFMPDDGEKISDALTTLERQGFELVSLDMKKTSTAQIAAQALVQ